MLQPWSAAALDPLESDKSFDVDAICDLADKFDPSTISGTTAGSFSATSFPLPNCGWMPRCSCGWAIAETAK
jgi:hypothetical protein